QCCKTSSDVGNQKQGKQRFHSAMSISVDGTNLEPAKPKNTVFGAFGKVWGVWKTVLLPARHPKNLFYRLLSFNSAGWRKNPIYVHVFYQIRQTYIGTFLKPTTDLFAPQHVRQAQ
ncbi:MAG TPA: hypothetical protein VGB67_05050, partial [Fibrella sp.]